MTLDHGESDNLIVRLRSVSCFTTVMLQPVVIPDDAPGGDGEIHSIHLTGCYKTQTRWWQVIRRCCWYSRCSVATLVISSMTNLPWYAFFSGAWYTNDQARWYKHFPPCQSHLVRMPISKNLDLYKKMVTQCAKDALVQIPIPGCCIFLEIRHDCWINKLYTSPSPSRKH